MSTSLDNLLNFCVEHELLDSDYARRIACEYERHWKSSYSVVVNCGVDEQKMYKIASEIHKIELITLNEINFEKDVLDIVPLKHSTQLFCLPYKMNSNGLYVVTCFWDKLEIVTRGMENITGKKIYVSLITSSDYDKLYNQLIILTPDRSI